MSIDLKKLENKLDEALSNETNETLTKFLTNKRMSNNKQSSVEWLIDKCACADLRPELWNIIKEQAKAMHKEEITNTYDDAIEDVRQDEERPLKGLEYYNVHFKKNSI